VKYGSNVARNFGRESLSVAPRRDHLDHSGSMLRNAPANRICGRPAPRDGLSLARNAPSFRKVPSRGQRS
jgi:hypothetical protein